MCEGTGVIGRRYTGQGQKYLCFYMRGFLGVSLIVYC